MNLDDSLGDRKPTDSEVNLVVTAARRLTGEHKAMRNGNGAWKVIAIGIAIAVGGNLAGWLWGSVKADLVDGKADETVVETLKTDNDKAHSAINDKLGKIDSRTKRDSRVTRSIARKLKIDIPPEPAPSEE